VRHTRGRAKKYSKGTDGGADEKPSQEKRWIQESLRAEGKESHPLRKKNVRQQKGGAFEGRKKGVPRQRGRKEKK